MDELRDIHLPDPISWWPPALGYWLVLGALILLIFCAVLLVRYLMRPTLKKQVLALLESIEETYKESKDTKQCLVAISALLRRATISSEKHKNGITGKAWLQHLDAKLEEPEFSEGAGQILLSGPYSDKTVAGDIEELMGLCRKWVRKL